MTNRIIKFRAWDRVTKQMFYLENMAMLCGFIEANIQNNTLQNIDWLQFTGLLDKNGKEIYEGDITESQGMTGHIFREEVVFWEGCFCHKTSDNRGHIFNPKHEVIIGNIYENPELLK